jgi:hypothetical protein
MGGGHCNSQCPETGGTVLKISAITGLQNGRFVALLCILQLVVLLLPQQAVVTRAYRRIPLETCFAPDIQQETTRLPRMTLAD